MAAANQKAPDSTGESGVTTVWPLAGTWQHIGKNPLDCRYILNYDEKNKTYTVEYKSSILPLPMISTAQPAPDCALTGWYWGRFEVKHPLNAANVSTKFYRFRLHKNQLEMELESTCQKAKLSSAGFKTVTEYCARAADTFK